MMPPILKVFQDWQRQVHPIPKIQQDEGAVCLFHLVSVKYQEI